MDCRVSTEPVTGMSTRDLRLEKASLLPALTRFYNDMAYRNANAKAERKENTQEFLEWKQRAQAFRSRVETRRSEITAELARRRYEQTP